MAGEQNGLQPQVFISHTAADEHGRIFAANIVQPALEAAGLATFIDHADLQLGCAWPAELAKAASTSAVFVVVLTQSYPTRFWCLRELDIAMHGHPDHPRAANPYIIPVYMHHHSLLQHLTVKQLRSDIQRRIKELAGDEDSAELQDLQRLDPERMLRNLQALKERQGARRQHEAVQLYATPQEQQQRQEQQQQQQQQQSAALPRSNSSSRAQVVHPAKNEEWVLARRVAAAALLQLPARQRLAYIPPGLVGYEQQLAELTAQLVVDEPGTLGLWLHGPGGLGKTTLAHLLFNTLSSTNKFAKAVMVELDLEGSSSEQLHRHLVQLLEGLGETVPVGSNAQLLQTLAQLVQKHKVLLLLDNVNHDHQLDGLLPTVFSSGSRIIITSRVQTLPSSTAYEAIFTEDAPALRHHSIKPLDAAPARQLFRRWHKLGEQQLQQLDLFTLENQLLQACSCLPLALRVIGGALRVEEGTSAGNTRKLWQEVAAAFGHGEWTPTDMGSSEAWLQGVVYHSFSRLSEAAQNMFLDSVSVLQGQPLCKAMLVWEAWWPGEAHQALRKLKQLSLINTKPVEDSLWLKYSILHDRIMTLDVIRVLGQSILLKAGRLGDKYVGSRMWVTSDGAVQGLIEGKQPVGVKMSGYTPAKACPVLQGCDFSAVRVFISDHLPHSVLHHATHLMWLGILVDMNLFGLHDFGSDCTCRYSLSGLPTAPRADTAVCLQELVVLDMPEDNPFLRGPRCECWEGLAATLAAVAALPSLRALEIDAEPLERWLDKDTLQALVSTLSSCKHLQQLTLCKAERQSWRQFPIKDLTDLQRLHWEHSGGLPDQCGKLTALCELYCRGQSILRLPFESMTALQVLSISFQSAGLSESFGGLAALRSLSLSYSKGLTCLPDSFGGLSALEELDLQRCINLTSLKDESLRGLAALTFLNLSGCGGLSSLPESLGGLTALEQLHISDCSMLSGLPESFGGLNALEVLYMKDCCMLSGLPNFFGGLSALQKLNLSRCGGLCSLPESLRGLAALTFLGLSGCGGLSSLPESLGGLTALEQLHIQDCSMLSGLPESFGGLNALEVLYMKDCCMLSGLPNSFGGLSALQELDLSRCGGLCSLPESFAGLTALQRLYMRSCAGLSSLPASFGALASLQRLHMPDCVGLSSLPESFGGLTALKGLDMSGCVGLSSLPDSFGGLASLQKLDLSESSKLASLPESFGGLTALEKLQMRNCRSLTSLRDESFRGLAALSFLDLSGCGGLTSLPESFGGLTALEELRLSECSMLSGLPESFDGLTALKELDMADCGGLLILPESFGDLAALQKLDMSCCGLRSLPKSFGGLAALQNLCMWGCDGLSCLPESFGSLASLQDLSLSCCNGLSCLPESFGGLTALQELGMFHCSSLSSLPTSFVQLTRLQLLWVMNDHQLPNLPEVLDKLTSLKIERLAPEATVQHRPPHEPAAGAV